MNIKIVWQYHVFVGKRKWFTSYFKENSSLNITVWPNPEHERESGGKENQWQYCTNMLNIHKEKFPYDSGLKTMSLKLKNEHPGTENLSITVSIDEGNHLYPVKRGLAKLIRVSDRQTNTEAGGNTNRAQRKKLGTLLIFDIKTYQKRANLFICLTNHYTLTASIWKRIIYKLKMQSSRA